MQRLRLHLTYLVSALLLCVKLLGFSLFLSLETIETRRYGVRARLHAHEVAWLSLTISCESKFAAALRFLADEIFQVESWFVLYWSRFHQFFLSPCDAFLFISPVCLISFWYVLIPASFARRDCFAGGSLIFVE